MEIAQITNPIAPRLSPLTGEAATGTFSDVLSSVFGLLFIVGILVFVVYFIIGAYQWITSSGDQKGVEKARNSIIQAIIGLVVLFSLFALLRLIGYVFDINLLQLDIGRLKL